MPPPAARRCCSATRSARRSACSPSSASAPTAPVFVHGAIDALLDAYRDEGIACADAPGRRASRKGESFAGELIIAPPSAFGSPWLRRFGDASTGFASGWMRVRGNRRRRGFDRGFVLSDHADWPALLRTIARDRRAARARDPRLQRQLWRATCARPASPRSRSRPCSKARSRTQRSEQIAVTTF